MIEPQLPSVEIVQCSLTAICKNELRAAVFMLLRNVCVPGTGCSVRLLTCRKHITTWTTGLCMPELHRTINMADVSPPHFQDY
jgi:hypothetical protein